MGDTTTNKDESPLTRARREFTGRHWVAVTLMGVPRGILNSLNLAALALIYVVCAETLTVVRESPWDLNYFNPSSAVVGLGQQCTMKPRRQMGPADGNLSIRPEA